MSEDGPVPPSTPLASTSEGLERAEPVATLEPHHTSIRHSQVTTLTERTTYLQQVQNLIEAIADWIDISYYAAGRPPECTLTLESAEYEHREWRTPGAVWQLAGRLARSLVQSAQDHEEAEPRPRPPTWRIGMVAGARRCVGDLDFTLPKNPDRDERARRRPPQVPRASG